MLWWLLAALSLIADGKAKLLYRLKQEERLNLWLKFYNDLLVNKIK